MQESITCRPMAPARARARKAKNFLWAESRRQPADNLVAARTATTFHMEAYLANGTDEAPFVRHGSAAEKRAVHVCYGLDRFRRRQIGACTATECRHGPFCLVDHLA